MTPDQLDFINSAIAVLKSYEKDDPAEDLIDVIETARDYLEQVLWIQEDM